MDRSLRMSGNLAAEVTHREMTQFGYRVIEKAPRSWRLKNSLRRSYIWGKVVNEAAAIFSKITGIPTITAELRGRLIPVLGSAVDYGVLGRRVVTDAGVDYLVDDWDAGAADINLMDFHGAGIGVVAAVVGDTALGTASTTQLNPDSTRATGTNTQPASNQLRTIGTLTWDAAQAVTEHGIFDQSAVPGGTLWDRTVFTAINVANGDSIEFTYTLTINSGG